MNPLIPVIMPIIGAVVGPAIAWSLSASATKRREAVAASDADRKLHEEHRTKAQEHEVRIADVHRRLVAVEKVADDITDIRVDMARVVQSIEGLKELVEALKK